MLVKAGPLPEPDALEDHWTAIYSEYCEAIGGIQLAAMKQRVRSANRISSRLERLHALIDVARYIVADEIISALAAEPELKLNAAQLASADEGEYHRQLDAMIGKLRPEQLKLSALAKNEAKSDNKLPEESDFDDCRFEIGKYAGYGMPDTVLLKDYCTGLRKLQEHIQKLSKPKGHGK